MKNFRTFNLALDFYEQARCQKLSGPLQLQLTRAAQSIALNLAEGRGRDKAADQNRFFHIAMGSLRECQAILMIAQLSGTAIWEKLDILGAHLYKLIKCCR